MPLTNEQWQNIAQAEKKRRLRSNLLTIIAFVVALVAVVAGLYARKQQKIAVQKQQELENAIFKAAVMRENDRSLYLRTNTNEIFYDNITTLDFSNFAITDLPNQVLLCPNLQTLNLGNNTIATLPESVGNLTNLQELDLGINCLMSLPQNLGKLPNLQILRLNNNPDLYTYSDQLYDKSLKTFLTKLSKGEIKFDVQTGLLNMYNRQIALVKQDSTDSYFWRGLSVCALYVNKPQEAIIAAQKTLALDKDSWSVVRYLALGYVFNNQYDEAEKIYLHWKEKSFISWHPCNPFPNYVYRPCKPIFLQDIIDLEAARITHPDFARVRALLQEK